MQAEMLGGKKNIYFYLTLKTCEVHKLQNSQGAARISNRFDFCTIVQFPIGSLSYFCISSSSDFKPADDSAFPTKAHYLMR